MTTKITYPQPHEGVQGTDLGKEHLLSLDDAAVEQRLELLDQVSGRWRDILEGRIADRGAAFERMDNPRVGDVVMEMTTSFRSNRVARVQGSGLLLVHRRQEWSCADEEWAQLVAEEKAAHEADGLAFDAEKFDKGRCADLFSYVQYGSGPEDVVRWSNCKFLAVPADLLQRFAGVQA